MKVCQETMGPKAICCYCCWWLIEMFTSSARLCNMMTATTATIAQQQLPQCVAAWADWGASLPDCSLAWGRLNYYHYNYNYDYEYCITGSSRHIESAVLCLTDLLQQCCCLTAALICDLLCMLWAMEEQEVEEEKRLRDREWKCKGSNWIWRLRELERERERERTFAWERERTSVRANCLDWVLN